MKEELIIRIVEAVLVIAFIFLSYYIKIREILKENVNTAIDDAEETNLIGAEKFKLAVDQLMTFVPAIVKPIITRKFVEQLVQSAFDKIESYARKQLQKKSKQEAELQDKFDN